MIGNPRTRFHQADGTPYPDWELVRLGDIYTERNEKGEDSLPILSVSIHSGVSDTEADDESLGKHVKRSEDKSLYKKVYPGDLVFNMMRAWQGAIGTVKNMGMVSPAYICAIPNERVYPAFMNYLMRTAAMIGTINRQSYGVTDFRKRLYWDSFANIKCALPCIDEQVRIYEFLEQLDGLIDSIDQEIVSLQRQKKESMSRVFSRNVRFKSDDGCEYPEWENITIGDFGEFFGGLSGKGKDDFNHGDGRFVTYMNVYKNTFADKDGVTAVEVQPNEKQNHIQYGDIMFTQSSENVEEVGLSSVWIHDTTPFMNSFCMALRPHKLKDMDIYYLGYVFRSDEVRKQIMMQGQGISRINLAASRIKDVTFPVPSLSEQKKIGQFLYDFDEAISAKQDMLKCWENIKKGLLQQMFT